MSMTYLPSWMITIPDRDNPDYFHYLTTKAKNDGMPEHVRLRLLRRYQEDHMELKKVY